MEIKFNIVLLDYTLYSLILAPAYYFLFPKLETSLKETKFLDIHNVKQNVTTESKRVSKMTVQVVSNNCTVTRKIILRQTELTSKHITQLNTVHSYLEVIALVLGINIHLVRMQSEIYIAV